MLRCALRYCGGCNPHFDRTALVRRLQAAHPELTVDTAPAGETYDFALAVCGCPRRCIGESDLPHATGHMVVTDASQYETLCETIAALRSKNTDKE